MNFWNHFYFLCQKLHTLCLFLELSPRSPLLQHAQRMVGLSRMAYQGLFYGARAQF
jgi:hypothetical protein